MLLAGTLLLPYFGLLQPLGETMLMVKKELCGGNQTFVVGQILSCPEGRVVGCGPQGPSGEAWEHMHHLAEPGMHHGLGWGS